MAASMLDWAERGVAAVAHYLGAFNPSILLSLPEGTSDSAKVHTYWYTTPRHFVLEWLGTHAALLPVIALLALMPWAVDVPRVVAAARVTAADVWTGRVTDPKAVSSQSLARKRGGGAGGCRCRSRACRCS